MTQKKYMRLKMVFKWLEGRTYRCVKCGEEYRHRTNYDKHIRNCIKEVGYGRKRR